MNNSRIEDLRLVDPVLTTLIHGYENSAFISEVLFPTVSVSRLKGKIPSFGKDAFLSRATERAFRATSNRIAPVDFELVNFATQEQDIETAIDYLEEEETPDFFRYEQRVARNLNDILRLGRESKAAELAQNPANFSDGMVYDITAGNSFNDPNSSIDPLSIVNDAKEAIRSRIARYPNTMVMGISVYKTLIEHPSITNLVQYSDFAKVNFEIISKLFGIDDIKIGLSVNNDNGNTFTDIWGGNIILAYVDKSPAIKRNEFNPSWGYTFVREGMPEIDSYYENGGKIKVIRCTDNYGISITGKDAAYLIKGAYQDIVEGGE